MDSNLSFQEVDGRWFDHIALGAMKVGQDDHETVIQPQSFQGNDVRHIFIGPSYASESMLWQQRPEEQEQPEQPAQPAEPAQVSRKAWRGQVWIYAGHKSTTMIPFLKNAFVQYAGKKDQSYLKSVALCCVANMQVSHRV